jgi:hypothetical protein
MKQQTLLFKLFGSGWLTLGLLCLALVGLQINGLDWGGRVGQALSGDAATLWRTFYHSLVTIVLLLCWGATCVVLGWNLIRLVNWAQPLAQAMHLLLAVYLIAALIVGSAVAPEAKEFLALGILLLAGDLGLAYPLRGRLAGEVFSQIPLRTAPVVSLRCEFCGASLDVRTGRCPECEPAINTDPHTAHRENPKPALVAHLISLDDGTVYPLSSQRPTLVGREFSRNDVNLNNPTVSRQHALVEYDVQNSRYTLSAMQDTNGTFVNDQLIRQRTLRDGDEIRFGRTRFRFRVVSGVENSGG